MAPKPQAIVLRATVLRADAAARKMDAGRRRADTALREEFKGRLRLEALGIMRGVAPEDTGLLKEVMEARFSLGGRGTSGEARILVHSPVRDPMSNYPYTGVTRFGHRRARIYPKHTTLPEAFKPGQKTLGDSGGGIPGPVGDPRQQFYLDRGHAPALQLPAAVGGGGGRSQLFAGSVGLIFRANVRGYRPAGDWVDRGIPLAERATAKAGDRIGKEIVVAAR